MAVGDQRVTNDRIANFDPADGLADLFDPAGVLVPHDVGKVHGSLIAPNAFHDVEIGIARTRAKYGQVSQISEVEQLFVEQIARARRFV